jgi:hypothetical protein
VSKFKFFIAGVQHHQLATIVKDIEVDYDFDLVPEPDNKYDPNAIRIETEGVMCGYVPKTFSAQVAAMIEAMGIDEVFCRVTHVDPDAKPWNMCEVEIGVIGLDDEPISNEGEEEFEDLDEDEEPEFFEEE